jgi:ssDNA-binding Zn-finger/Zn-ribbon topoisomerase 1
MTTIAKDYVPNGIEWTCYYCNKDRTFRAGKPAVYGADPCPVCGELRKPYKYPTEDEMRASGCIPAPARVLRALPPTNVGHQVDWDE